MHILFETERLALRELVLEDLDFVAAMLAHPQVMEFWPRTYTREEAEAWIQRQQARYAKDGYGYWLVLKKADGQPIGQAGLLRLEIDGTSEISIGYIIHRPFWRRGFATEAASACREYAFGKLGKELIVIPVRAENAGSQAVARKIGATAVKETHYAGFVHTVFALHRPGLA